MNAKQKSIRGRRAAKRTTKRRRNPAGWGGKARRTFIALPLAASAYPGTTKGARTHIVERTPGASRQPLCKRVSADSVLWDLSQVREPEWASCPACRSRWARILMGEVKNPQGKRTTKRAKRNPLLGIFGANPRARVVRELGRVVEVRYKRKDDGGLYFHKYSSKPRLLALSDGSIWIKGA